MDRALERYREWLADPLIDEETKNELRRISGQKEEIEDRFYKDLRFGTGGLRGVIGAGTNRINRYTVRKATQGLAEYLLELRPDVFSAVVIAYDSRHGSREFALEAALVLAGNGIRAYLFESLRPTPELSFAVRHLGAAAGIVITASHNPPEYNGYKVYDHTGCQLVPHLAAKVTEKIDRVESLARVKRMDARAAEEKGLLVFIGAEVDDSYVRAVTAISCSRPEEMAHGKTKGGLEETAGGALKIVYTPLHGAGGPIVPRVLKEIGFREVYVVPEQAQPDPQFSTVRTPNPEEPDALDLALRHARRLGADLVLGTDPDCDRVGAAMRSAAGDYRLLSGNEAGALMVHYLLSSLKEKGELPADGAVVKTIVTGELGAKIAESYGVRVFQTLTGFKFIGEKMNEFEREKSYRFLFGYEESYGYLAGTYARDKDAVVASMLLAEMAAFYKRRGKTLLDVLEDLRQKHGWFLESLESRTLKGKDGQEKMERMMEGWRSQPPQEAAGIPVQEIRDYLPGYEGFPPENALKFILSDGSWFCLRPSGTEPKIKVYFGVCGVSREDAENRLQTLKEWVMDRVDREVGNR